MDNSTDSALNVTTQFTDGSVYTSDATTTLFELSSVTSFLTSTNMTISSNATTKKLFVKPSPLPSAITFTLGVVGNIIAIIVLLKASKRHKWNVFYRFVTALAITDLFGIMTSSPVAFAVYDNNLKWVGGQPVCHYMSFMLIFSGLATVLLVGAMALDRYMAILHPFKYNVSARYTIVNIVILGILLFSLLVACLPLLGLGENVRQFPGTWCFFNAFGYRIEDEIFVYFYTSLGLGTILGTGILNICVIGGLIVGKRSHARRGSMCSRKARARADVYITIFLVAIFVVFAVCWAPFLIRIIINQTHAFPTNRKADLLTLRLATLNQILDPWVYILFRRETLSRVSRFLRKHKKGSFFRRLASFTGSSKSTTQNTEISSHGTNGTPIPHRRHIINRLVPKDSIDSTKDETDTRYTVTYKRDDSKDKTLTSQNSL